MFYGGINGLLFKISASSRFGMLHPISGKSCHILKPLKLNCSLALPLLSVLIFFQLTVIVFPLTRRAISAVELKAVSDSIQIRLKCVEMYSASDRKSVDMITKLRSQNLMQLVEGGYHDKVYNHCCKHFYFSGRLTTIIDQDNALHVYERREKNQLYL